MTPHPNPPFLLMVVVAVVLAPLVLLGAVGLVLLDPEELEAEASASAELPRAIVTA